MREPPAILRELGGRIDWVSGVVPGLSTALVPRGLADVAVALLGHDPDVEIATADPIGQSSSVPNDPSYNLEYAGYTTFKPCLELAWNVRHDTDSRIIAIIDSGLILDNPGFHDFDLNLWQNPGEVPFGNNMIDDDNDGIINDFYGAEFIPEGDLYESSPPNMPRSYPLDYSGHGTIVASILGATGNNGSGLAGVARRCTLMPVKVEGGIGFYFSACLKGIEYAHNKGSRLMNCSWTFSYAPGETPAVLDPLRLEMEQYSDTLFVVASGNRFDVVGGGYNLDATSGPGVDLYPQEWTMAHMIVVGNSTTTDGRYSESHWGPTSVDVFAPGTDMVGYNTTGQVISAMSGSSWSAPIVTGMAALYWSNNPSSSPTAVKGKIMGSGILPSALNGLCVGTGAKCSRVNPAALLQAGTCP